MITLQTFINELVVGCYRKLKFEIDLNGLEYECVFVNTKR